MSGTERIRDQGAVYRNFAKGGGGGGREAGKFEAWKRGGQKIRRGSDM